MKNWLTIKVEHFGDMTICREVFWFVGMFFLGIMFQYCLAHVFAMVFYNFDRWFSSHMSNYVALTAVRCYLWGALTVIIIWAIVDILKAIMNKKTGRKKAPKV